MNTTLSAPPGRRHPPDTHADRRTRRIGPIDRLALHLGVALITWSRRPVVHAEPLDRDSAMLQHRQALERDRLRRDAELAVLSAGTRWW